MRYPGGKNGSGVYQTLINLMPPHSIYVEPFLGSGAILRLKKPAPAGSIAIDIDAEIISGFPSNSIPNLTLLHGDATTWLKDAGNLPWSALIYLDPPYLLSSRSSSRQIYRYEFCMPSEHSHLLDLITPLDCMVMISGYYSQLYADRLSSWRLVQFPAQTRGGRTATECVWCNFPEPFELHDYRYLGSNFRERERIKRKKTRWVNKLKHMPPLERHALAAAIAEISGTIDDPPMLDDAGDNLVASLFPQLQDPEKPVYKQLQMIELTRATIPTNDDAAPRVK